MNKLKSFEQSGKNTLSKKFIFIFVFIIIISMEMNVIFTYISQNKAYNDRCKNNLENVTRSIAARIINEKNEFICLQNNFKKFKDDIRIDYDFNGDYSLDKEKFMIYFNSKYPGKTMFDDIYFDELDKTAQILWMTYEYEKWLFSFEAMRDSFKLNYVYYIFPTSANDMCYMIDGFREEKIYQGKSIINLGFEGKMDRATHKNMWATWDNQAVTGDVDVTDNEYGYVYTAYYPVIIDGQLIGLTAAEMDVNTTNSMIMNEVWKQSLIFLIVLGLSSLLALLFISKTIIKRIVQLDRQIQNYSKTKNPETAIIVNEYSKTGGDEISTLCKNFTKMTMELEEYMENLQIITAEQERISTELSLATNIQAAMLPHNYTDCSEYSLYAIMDPAKEVGGDFYDFFMIDDEWIALVIADVSGKGVPAALFMVVAKILIRNHMKNKESVEEVFYNTNNQLTEGNGEGLFVTAWLGVLNIKTGILNYVEAGHENPFIISKNGNIKEVKPKMKKMPLAAFDNTVYVPNQIKLEKGDKLFLYTDGIPEAANCNDEFYGLERTKAIISKTSNLTPKEMLELIIKDIDSFVGDAPQFDDLTALVIELK